MIRQLGVDVGLDGRLRDGSVSSQAARIVNGAGSGIASGAHAPARRALGRVAALGGRRPVSLGRAARCLTSCVSVHGWMAAKGLMVTRDALDGASLHLSSCQGSPGEARSRSTSCSVASFREARCV